MILGAILGTVLIVGCVPVTDQSPPTTTTTEPTVVCQSVDLC